VVDACARAVVHLYLRSAHRQELVDVGPYRLMRHPGYLGSLLTWLGFAFTSQSHSVLSLVAALLGGAGIGVP